MAFVLLTMGWLIVGSGDAVPPDTFRIECAGQTSDSVHLAWETDRQVRSLRTGADWSPSTPTGPTHQAAPAPGEGRHGTTAAKIVGTAKADNARACFLQNLDELRQGRLVYAYNKFEHLYGSRTDPARLYGCFLGTLTPQ